ncbi:hypothetical protein PHISP_02186 [Aspergillus sp. HF37]|nr:hypothetical protein PHISP_02186 [Aspergillus sp. HF37]
MAASKPLQTTAIGWVLIAAGHTLSARDWQTLPKFHQLPNLAYTCARAGWFQGSGFFLMTALLNYHWSQNPEQLRLPVNKAVAALATAIVWASSAWYVKRGVNATGAVVAAMGALQAWSAFGS